VSRSSAATCSAKHFVDVALRILPAITVQTRAMLAGRHQRIKRVNDVHCLFLDIVERRNTLARRWWSDPENFTPRKISIARFCIKPGPGLQ
jgi:hypothetical protein